MGVLKSLVKKSTYETGANYELGRSLSSASISNIFGTGGDDIDVLREYSGFVWKAINIRSEELSSLDFFVERRVADQWQADYKHEFNDVMQGEDGGLDEAEFIEGHQVYMDMYGEAFWYFSKGERSSKPFSRYLLDPNKMSLVIQDKRVVNYVYQENSQRIVFDTDEIAHFRIFNPLSEYRGAGPMQKAGWFVRSNRYATTFVNNFLENNAIPAGVIVAKNQVDDKDWNLFKKQWASNYGGIDNQGKTAFVRGNDLEFIKTGIDLGEVDFDKVTNSSKADILQMFSVPKSKLGEFSDFNRASAVESEASWAKTFTKPAVSRITRKISRKVTNWYGEQFQFGSNFILPEDRDQKLKEFDKGVNRWLTVNEAREAYGLPPLGKEYDELYIDGIRPPLAEPKSLGKITIRTKNTKAQFDYQMKESFRSKTEDTQVKYEQKFAQAVNPVLKDQKQAVLDQLQPKKLADATLDVDKEAQKLDDLLIPIMIELAAEQGQSALSFVGNDSLSFDVTPVVAKYIRDSIGKATRTFTKETQDLIAKRVADGLNNGDSMNEIANSIGSLYDDVLLGKDATGYRLERLSRTEVIKTSNAITEAAYKQSGVVSKKEWFANPGACTQCMAFNNSTIQLDGIFQPKGVPYTGTDGGTYVNNYEDVRHPGLHPNCRCTLVPVID